MLMGTTVIDEKIGGKKSYILHKVVNNMLLEKKDKAVNDMLLEFCFCLLFFRHLFPVKITIQS
jgi:hypothetical protein